MNEKIKAAKDRAERCKCTCNGCSFAKKSAENLEKATVLDDFELNLILNSHCDCNACKGILEGGADGAAAGYEMPWTKMEPK